jgi:hypothetical protein
VDFPHPTRGKATAKLPGSGRAFTPAWVAFRQDGRALRLTQHPKTDEGKPYGWKDLLKGMASSSTSSTDLLPICTGSTSTSAPVCRILCQPETAHHRPHHDRRGAGAGGQRNQSARYPRQGDEIKTARDDTHFFTLSQVRTIYENSEKNPAVASSSRAKSSAPWYTSAEAGDDLRPPAAPGDSRVATSIARNLGKPSAGLDR